MQRKMCLVYHGVLALRIEDEVLSVQYNAGLTVGNIARGLGKFLNAIKGHGVGLNTAIALNNRHIARE